MIDLKSIRESYTKREIANIALIASEVNPADALTKINSTPSLRALIDSSLVNHPILQFVIEPNAPIHVHSSITPERLRVQENTGSVCAERKSPSVAQVGD